MAYLTIVIQSNSSSVAQLNQRQVDATKPSEELNALIDYLARVAGGFEVTPSFYVVTNNSDPAVATDGGASTKITFTNP